MKTLIFNEANLQENEIDEIVTRVKVFLINYKNDIYYAISNGGVQLPGGHVEKGEEYIDAIKREIQEEVGVVLEDKEISNPFFEIKHFTKNYSGSDKNRISNVIYYFARTSKKCNIENINLTEDEKKNKFTIYKINCNAFEEYLKNYMEKEILETNKVIEKEILIAYEELKKILV